MSDDIEAELRHWVGKPIRLRARAPMLDDQTLAHLRLIGPFELEIDGEWTHYVFSPAPDEAERQHALVVAYQEHARAQQLDPSAQSIANVDRDERNAAVARQRFLAALPRDAALLDRRVPIHFDANGDIFILLESSACYLTKGGEWREGLKPAPPAEHEPAPWIAQIGEIRQRVDEVSLALSAELADVGLAVCRLRNELTVKLQPKRPWWRFWSNR